MKKFLSNPTDNAKKKSKILGGAKGENRKTSNDLEYYLFAMPHRSFKVKSFNLISR